MKKKKILIVEDDAKIRAALTIRLQNAGLEVIAAPNGLEGLKSALADTPDLILSDIWMPNGMGLSMAQRLEDLGLAGIPLIFITAGKQEGLRAAADEVGAIGFFEKPYEFAQLLAAINDALEHQRPAVPQKQ